MHIKAIAIATIISASPLSAQAKHKPVDPWFGNDKPRHFLMAGFVESLTFGGLELAGANRSTSKVGAISAATIISIGREIHDRKVEKGFSVKDLAWDGLGMAAAFLVINKTQR